MIKAGKDKPVDIMPFRIYNRDAFLFQEHPPLIPHTPEYSSYWLEQLKRSIEGFWGLDKKDGNGGWRFMPGNLYSYISFGEVLQQKPGEPEVKAPPLLRDIEWLVFYALTTCDGFSGFEDDTEYTSFKIVDKIEKGLRLSHIEKKDLEEDLYHDQLYHNGKLKKYIDPREYLYKTHDKPLGKPHFNNPCTNLMWLSSRGVGKSLVMGGEINGCFTFHGCRSVYEYLEGKQSTTIVVGSANSTKSDELLEKFSSLNDRLRSDIGSYRSDNISMPGAFWQPSAGSLKLGNTFTKRIKLEGGKGYAGRDTKIVHVSFKANASAGVGYRARRIVCEEVGLLSNFHAVHGENNGSQMRNTKIGFSIYIGTGGDIEKIKEVREAFNNPAAFDILEYQDIFNNNGKNIGLFIPCYYGKNAYKDENGNTQLQEAWEDEIEVRNEIRKKSSKSYQKHIISFPMYPQEMFMQDTEGVFPTELIEERIHEIENSDLVSKYSVGKLTYANQTNSLCRWDEDTRGTLKPYLRFSDINDKNRENRNGAIVIFEHPVKNKPERNSPVPLYIAIYDPVESDDSKDSTAESLCCVTVFKCYDLDNPDGIQYNIVAEWIGRHEMLDHNHEMAFRLAAYYNCKILPETNKSDIIRYARMTNRYHWLEYRPGLAIDGKHNSKKEYEVGFKCLAGMIPKLLLDLNDLLRTETGDSEEKLIDNELIVINKPMVKGMMSMMALEQLLYYNRDDNFDYVSALFGVALWARQREMKPLKYSVINEHQKDMDSLKKFLSKQKLKNNNSGAQNPAFNF